MIPYDYSHRSGVRHLTWEDFESLTRKLAERLELYHPQVVIGIARGGLFPAVQVAGSLRCELFPIRLTRRMNDLVVSDRPIWKTPIPHDVLGKNVVVIDDVADTGTTISLAAAKARTMGAIQVITACLISHTWANPAPQVSALISDEFVIFPWYEQVLENGVWVAHPEVEAGIKAQTKTPEN